MPYKILIFKLFQCLGDKPGQSGAHMETRDQGSDCRGGGGHHACQEGQEKEKEKENKIRRKKKKKKEKEVEEKWEGKGEKDT